jgi:hypothetical protein
MKTLKEYLIEYSAAKGWDLADEDLFDTFESVAKFIMKDDEDEHRWYTIWRNVYSIEIDGVQRYFEMYIPEMHSEEGSWDDIGFTPDLDNAKEVFPKEVTRIIYV